MLWSWQNTFGAAIEKSNKGIVRDVNGWIRIGGQSVCYPLPVSEDEPGDSAMTAQVIFCCLSKGPSKCFETCLDNMVWVLPSKLQRKNGAGSGSRGAGSWSCQLPSRSSNKVKSTISTLMLSLWCAWLLTTEIVPLIQLFWREFDLSNEHIAICYLTDVKSHPRCIHQRLEKVLNQLEPQWINKTFA